MTRSAHDDDADAFRTRGWPYLLGAVLVVLAMVGGLLLGRSTAPAQADVPTDEVSIGFLQAMGAHHAQAVEMASIAHRRVDEPGLQYLAFDLLTTQQGQIEIMSALLSTAEQPQTNGGSMGWMGHDGRMPGMATAAELEALEALPLPSLEEQWLRLMIRHHAGAVPMAAYAARGAASPQVARLARTMEQGQASEIDAMNDMLRARRLAPEVVDLDAEPSGSAPAHGGHGG